MTTRARVLNARMSELIRRSAERSSGPVRGGMFNRLVPARLRVAAGLSPMESTATNPTRTPSRSTVTGLRAWARFCPAPTISIVDLEKRDKVCA